MGLRAAGERGTSSLSHLSLEEESETGERMDSGTGARAVAESLRSHHCGERYVVLGGELKGSFLDAPLIYTLRKVVE